jgi:hypothetical protein
MLHNLNVMTDFMDIIHRPGLYLNTTFRRLDCLRPQVRSLLSWAQSTELVAISEKSIIVLLYNRHKFLHVI